MKLIRDSGKDHWMIGRIIECERCDSQYMIESIEDLNYSSSDTVAKTTCPKCRHCQITNKPRKQAITYPYGTTTNTWDLYVKDVDTSL